MKKILITLMLAIMTGITFGQEVEFKAEISDMCPMKFPSRYGLTGFTLEVTNDTAYVNMPYMGEVYNPTFNNDGMHFVEPVKSLKVKARKKNDGKEVSFSVKHDFVKYDFTVTLFDNNRCFVFMRPSNGDSCDYSGLWE